MRDSIDIDLGAGEKEDQRKVLNVRVYYSKGGLNYWNYKTDPRGYYLSVTPQVVDGMWRTTSITPGSTKGGFKQCFEVVKRMNNKRLTELQQLIFNGITPEIEDNIRQLYQLDQALAIYEQIMGGAGLPLEIAA